MIDLSAFSRARLCARLVKLEALAALSRMVSDALVDRLLRAERENAALYLVLERKVAEHTDLRRQLANVTPFTALDALRSAPGWQTAMPTLAEIEAHAEAFPYGPEDDGEETDPDGEFVGGLWAFQDASGVGLVELYRGRHRTPWMMYAGANALRAECDLASWNDDERVTSWLRLTADGRPVGR